MTECDRIIKQGILPRDFFCEEIRNDYLVSIEQKKIWAVELDMLLYFDRFCKKHNLKYFLMFGSLLGAVRHKGFIPWDDDVDVGMIRKDYEKLISLSNNIEKPYFLQTPYTDPGYYYSYIKLRNSNTSGITTQFMFQNINWGLMLDIYPIDNFVHKGGKERYKEVSKLATDNSNFMRCSNPHLIGNERHRALDYSGRNPLKNYEDIQRVSRQFENMNTEYVATSTITVYSYERTMMKKKDISESCMLEFEGFLFPAPIGYRNVLKVLYGKSFMEFPPIEERGNWHDNVIYDPDVPYKKKIKEMEENKSD